jgi:hypothetical protein
VASLDDSEVTDGNGRPQVVDEEHRVKALASLARKFLDANLLSSTSPEEFLGEVNDRVRFSVQTPEQGYGATLAAVLDGLRAQGYEINPEHDIKNFWRPGNRHNGVNVTARTPEGSTIEIQFPTPASRALGKQTHELYETVRLGSLTPEARLDALLTIFRLNREADIANRLPDGLDTLPAAINTSFAAWVAREPTTWAQYQLALAADGRTFAEVAAGYGLDLRDFPGGERLGLPDGRAVELPHSVQGREDPGSDQRDRGVGSGPGAPSGRDVEPAAVGLGLGARAGGAEAVRRPVSGDDPAGGSADRGTGSPRSGDEPAGRGSTPGDHFGGRAAEPAVGSDDAGVVNDEHRGDAAAAPAPTAPPAVEPPDVTPPADAPGAAPPGSGPQGPDRPSSGSSPASEDPAPTPATEAHTDSAGGAVPAPIHTLAEAAGIDDALAAGWTPVEIAAELDAETLQRLGPQLTAGDAADIANLLADPRVQAMFEQMAASPDPQEPDLDRRLITQLAAQPDLARIILASPELASVFAARPITLHHVALYPEAIQALQEVLADIEARGPEAVGARGEPPADPTPLTPRQLEISRSISGSDEPAQQPGFNHGRRNDPDYQEEYLDGLYANWRSRQDELNEVAFRHARQGEDGSGIPDWRKREKDRGRAWQKMRRYGGDVSLLTDLVGASIQFETLDDLYGALERINSDPAVDIVRFEDRFLAPEAGGYRDVQMRVRLRDGHIAELRLHLAALDEVARWEHAIFEVRRDIDALAEAEGRPVTPMEYAIRVRILQTQQELFWAAMRSAMGEGTTDA